jgi:type II secretory pathway component PulF
MSLIFSPRQLDHRAELYLRLAQFTSAGLGLIPALETLSRSAPSPSFISPLRRVVEHLNTGASFQDALIRAGDWLPEFDTALLGAAEQSGRLDAVFRSLSEYYAGRAKLARELIGGLLYPVFVFHLAVLIFPIEKFQNLVLQGNVAAFAIQTLAVLLPLYAIIFALVFIAQARHAEGWRSMLESVLKPVPVLGAARHSLALARLAAALEALISAGVTIIEAWELAARASGSPSIKSAVLSWKPRLRAGETPADAVKTSRQFPELFANLYFTGEISGKLDETLRRLRAFYEEEATRKIRLIVQWVPKFVYIGVAVLVGYKIVQFYTGLYGGNSDLSNILNGF